MSTYNIWKVSPDQRWLQSDAPGTTPREALEKAAHGRHANLYEEGAVFVVTDRNGGRYGAAVLRLERESPVPPPLTSVAVKF